MITRWRSFPCRGRAATWWRRRPVATRIALQSTSSIQACAFESKTTMTPVMTSLLATQSCNLRIAPMDAASGAGVLGTANFAPYVQFSMPDSWQGLEIDQGLRIAGQTVTAGGTPLQT